MILDFWVSLWSVEEHVPTIFIVMLLFSGYRICEISNFSFFPRVLEVPNTMYPVLKLNSETVKILILEEFVFPDSRDLYNSFDTIFVLVYSVMNK